MIKAILSLLFLALSASLATAGLYLNPEGVVIAAISAARDDRLSQFLRCCDVPEIATDPKHAMSALALVNLLKPVKFSDIRLETVRTDKRSERIMVRMIAPRRVEFDLVGTAEITGTSWRIVAVRL